MRTPGFLHTIADRLTRLIHDRRGNIAVTFALATLPVVSILTLAGRSPLRGWRTAVK